MDVMPEVERLERDGGLPSDQKRTRLHRQHGPRSSAPSMPDISLANLTLECRQPTSSGRMYPQHSGPFATLPRVLVSGQKLGILRRSSRFSTHVLVPPPHMRRRSLDPPAFQGPAESPILRTRTPCSGNNSPMLITRKTLIPPLNLRAPVPPLFYYSIVALPLRGGKAIHPLQPVWLTLLVGDGLWRTAVSNAQEHFTPLHDSITHTVLGKPHHLPTPPF